MRLSALFGIVSLLPSVAFATVPEPDDAHKGAQGPSTICEVTAKDAASFPVAVNNSGNYSQLTQNEDYFIVISQDEMTIWAFNMPTDKMPPSAVCTRLIREADGSVDGDFAMRCDGEKAACDKVYEEWLGYHQSVTLKRVNSGSKENRN